MKKFSISEIADKHHIDVNIIKDAIKHKFLDTDNNENVYWNYYYVKFIKANGDLSKLKTLSGRKGIRLETINKWELFHSKNKYEHIIQVCPKPKCFKSIDDVAVFKHSNFNECYAKAKAYALNNVDYAKYSYRGKKEGLSTTVILTYTEINYMLKLIPNLSRNKFLLKKFNNALLKSKSKYQSYHSNKKNEK